MNARVADVVIVVDGKVLLVQQLKESARGLWSYPGGRVEDFETIEEAVAREVKEELGIELIDPKLFKKYTITTPIGPLEINTFTGSIGDQEINLKEDELSDFGWFSIDEMEAMSDLRGELVLQQAKDVLNV